MALFPVMASTMDFRLNRLPWATAKTAREVRGAVSALPHLTGCPPTPRARSRGQRAAGQSRRKEAIHKAASVTHIPALGPAALGEYYESLSGDFSLPGTVLGPLLCINSWSAHCNPSGCYCGVAVPFYR